MERLIYSTLGYILGFGLSVLLWGQQVGGTGIVPNLRITLGNKTLALHHWMGFLALILILVAFRTKFKFTDEIFYFILGFGFGGLNQGLTFSDWKTIIF